MSNLKTYGVGALVALVVALGASYLVKPDVPKQEKVNVEKIINQIQEKMNLGAFPGQDFLVDYLNFNGIEKNFRRQTLRTATSTICSLRAPRNATSTLAFAQIHVHNATATALVLEVAKASGGFATTTTLVRGSDINGQLFALGAQARNSIRFAEATYATSTPNAPTTVLVTASTLNPDFEFAPGDFLNVRVGGAAGDVDFGGNNAVTYRNYSPVGSCSAEFIGY